MTDPTHATLAAEPRPALVPTRFRSPLFHVVDNAVPDDTAAKLGAWLYHERARLVRVGDDAGEHRFAFETGLDDAPAGILAPLRRQLLALAGDPAVLAKLCTPEFDVLGIDLRAALLHHGGFDSWHDDTEDDPRLERRLAFTLFLHAEPRLFAGGEVEFQDGTTIGPKNGRLALWHPFQQHRERKVECWSAHVLSGRWAVAGWLLGAPPEGWAERVAQLR